MQTATTTLSTFAHSHLTWLLKQAQSDASWHSERAAFWRERVQLWKSLDDAQADVQRCKRQAKHHQMMMQWANQRAAEYKLVLG
jgi:Tfp pilus assembly protein PilV